MSELEEDRKELRRKVELFHALSALKTNVNFQKLIVTGFMREEVINLTRMASKEMTAEAKIARGQQAQAAFVLEDFLSRVHNEGEDARDKIPALDQLIDEAAQQEET